MQFADYGRLFASSFDNTASIVVLDEKHSFSSCIHLVGHTTWVKIILPLPSSNQCISCDDKTIKVWDCENGSCVRTLTEHTSTVASLAVHSNGRFFASAAYYQTVNIWLTDTLEVLLRIWFPDAALSLVFDEGNTLYAGVLNHGVMSCNTVDGEVGPVCIRSTGRIDSLALGETCLAVINASHSHSHLHSTLAETLDSLRTFSSVCIHTGQRAYGRDCAVEAEITRATDAGAT